MNIFIFLGSFFVQVLEAQDCGESTCGACTVDGIAGACRWNPSTGVCFSGTPFVSTSQDVSQQSDCPPIPGDTDLCEDVEGYITYSNEGQTSNLISCQFLASFDECVDGCDFCSAFDWNEKTGECCYWPISALPTTLDLMGNVCTYFVATLDRFPCALENCECFTTCQGCTQLGLSSPCRWDIDNRVCFTGESGTPLAENEAGSSGGCPQCEIFDGYVLFENQGADGGSCSNNPIDICYEKCEDILCIAFDWNRDNCCIWSFQPDNLKNMFVCTYIRASVLFPTDPPEPPPVLPTLGIEGSDYTYQEFSGFWCNSKIYSALQDFGGSAIGRISCPNDVNSFSECLNSAFKYCDADPNCRAFEWYSSASIDSNDQSSDHWHGVRGLTYYYPCNDSVRIKQSGATMWTKTLSPDNETDYEISDGFWCNPSSYSAEDEFGGAHGQIQCSEDGTTTDCLQSAFDYCTRDPNCKAIENSVSFLGGEGLTFFYPCEEVILDAFDKGTIWIKIPQEDTQPEGSLLREGYIFSADTNCNSNSPLRIPDGSTSRETSIEECITICGHFDSCAGFTYVRAGEPGSDGRDFIPNTSGSGACFFKTDVSKRSQTSGQDCYAKLPGDSNIIACEDVDYASLECNSDQLINLVSYNFGRTERSPSVCPRFGQDSNTDGCFSENDFIIEQSCQFQQSCLVQSSADVFQDDCPDTYKYLDITYQCSGCCDEVASRCLQYGTCLNSLLLLVNSNCSQLPTAKDCWEVDGTGSFAADFLVFQELYKCRMSCDIQDEVIGGWEHFRGYWCTDDGRARLENGTTIDQCQSLCGDDCNAVEWWAGSRECFQCTDLTLMTSFVHAFDLSDPVHLFVQDCISQSSDGTRDWPDLGCSEDPTPCQTNGQANGDSWSTFVCQQNDFSIGHWLADEESGCSGDVSLDCFDERPCRNPSMQKKCSQESQLPVRFSCCGKILKSSHSSNPSKVGLIVGTVIGSITFFCCLFCVYWCFKQETETSIFPIQDKFPDSHDLEDISTVNSSYRRMSGKIEGSSTRSIRSIKSDDALSEVQNGQTGKTPPRYESVGGDVEFSVPNY